MLDNLHDQNDASSLRTIKASVAMFALNLLENKSR